MSTILNIYFVYYKPLFEIILTQNLPMYHSIQSDIQVIGVLERKISRHILVYCTYLPSIPTIIILIIK